MNKFNQVFKLKKCKVDFMDHGKRVSKLAAELAIKCRMESNLNNLLLAAEFHDIGKVNIPDEILNKPSKLSDYEFFIIQTHPLHSYNLLKSHYIAEDVAQLALYHHENYDGTGYNYKLKGEEIPLGSRIIRICDTFDALTSDRPYRKKLSYLEAIKIMDREQSKFDPELYLKFKDYVLNLSTNTKGRVLI